MLHSVDKTIVFSEKEPIDALKVTIIVLIGQLLPRHHLLNPRDGTASLERFLPFPSLGKPALWPLLNGVFWNIPDTQALQHSGQDRTQYFLENQAVH